MQEFDALLERARQGDRDALGQLLDRYRDRLRDTANGSLGNRILVRADASDVVQQSILSAFRSFHEFVGSNDAQLAAWLDRIHERNIQDTIRMHATAQKRSVSKQVSIDAAGGEIPGHHPITNEGEGSAVARSREEIESLMIQIERLPADQRDAVKMRHLSGKGLAEIAVEMDRSKLAVAALIKRGLEKLRRKATTDEQSDK